MYNQLQFQFFRFLLYVKSIGSCKHIVKALRLPLTFYSSPARGEVKWKKGEKGYCYAQIQYRTGERGGVKRLVARGKISRLSLFFKEGWIPAFAGMTNRHMLRSG